MPYISYEDFLAHKGTPQRFAFDPNGSGRYREGSGENPFQHQAFLNLGQQIRYLTQQGLSDKAIAEKLGIYASDYDEEHGRPSSKKVREIRAAVKELEYQNNCMTARKLYSDMMTKNGKANVSEIARQMKTNESNVRNYLKDYEDERKLQIIGTANFLRDKMKDTRFLMLGEAAELDLGITPEKLDAAITLLEQEGFHKEIIKENQLTTNHKTTIELLCRPEDTWGDIQRNKDEIDYIVECSPDKGKTIWAPEYPAAISSDRVKIRYAEDGGKSKDGVIELRRDVPDLSLGDSNYAQVRINVDDKLYLKGMALYSDDIPEGYDIVFNTNKSNSKSFEEVLKPLKAGAANPFGATIKAKGQYHYTDENGEDKLGAINKLNEEGDWGTWSKTLSAQFLSKQPEKLIEKQLKATVLEKEDELSDIHTITNPVVRSKFLVDFGDACDKSASELKSTGFPGQASYVITPIPSLKENEVYAPKFENGQRVTLVRYPHAGPFEMPVLTVNNSNKEAKQTLGNPRDAIGIHPTAAAQLSGADFDGDTVVLIPISGGTGNYKTSLRTEPYIESLRTFDPDIYKRPDNAKPIKEDTKQREMGKITNLITDMSFQHPTEDEVARAVKHSMVVIDCVKHNYDYKKSAEDNRIEELKKKYQKNPDKKRGYGGATSIVSLSDSTTRVDERESTSTIDPETGKRVYKETGRTTYTDYRDNNKEKWAFTKVKRMSEVDDAMDLVSAIKHPVEILYANFANHMKSYANSTRKEAVTLKKDQYSREAADKYAGEIESINEKLDTYKRNKPRERMALIYGNQVLKAMKKEDPTLTEKGQEEHLKRVKQQIATASRAKYGSDRKGVQIHLTDKEWEACNAGAFSNSKLSTIINAMDKDELRSFAIPKQDRSISKSKEALIKSKLAAGWTIADIAKSVNVSTSTVEKYM
jgi:hypothetical protein